MGPDFDRDTLLNGDETSIYVDPPTTASYAPVGSRRVETVTSGQQKTRVSVCFTATASGRKLKPLILIPRKTPLKNWVPPNNVQVAYGTNGCFNESVVCEHFIPLLVQFKNENQLRQLNFVYDQAPCHTTQRVKTNFANASVRVKYVPKRMTPLLQPADVSWMRPLKVAYFKKWNHWLVHAPKSYTAAGNVKSPGYATVITWISEIWQDLDPALIARSFDHCGITSKSLADYGSQLRHFVRTNQLVEDVMPIDPALADTNGGLDDQHGDEWDAEMEAILDSESDSEPEDREE
jgi:hypothetical protein